jgi:osmotically-inducible protein OsmY
MRRTSSQASFVVLALAVVVLSCDGDHRTVGSAPVAADAASAAPRPSLSASAAVAVEGSAPIPDERLASALEESIERDPAFLSQGLHVAVAKGAVTLTGTVRTLARKWRAAQLVDAFKGVRSVTNGIVVSSGVQPDAAITTEVNGAIKNDPATRSANVQATVSAATVTLRGTADSYAQKDLLADAASRVPGVQDVSVAIAIAKVSARSDAEIAVDATDELRGDAWLDGTHIAVAVHGKQAILTGDVGSLAQRDAAIEDAFRAGVASVDAHTLHVDWRESERTAAGAERLPPSDSEVKDAIGRRLASDTQLGMQLPIVQVARGVATLSGTVLDFRAARAAVSDARRVSGVWRVEDRVTVPAAKRENDVTIQARVLRGIYADVAAPDSHDVHVTTANARVTLQGAVASQEDRKVIEDDTEEVPGVVAVVDELRVRGPGPGTLAASEETLRHRVVEGLFWDPRVNASQITVAVAPGGDVTLGGHVDGRGEARVAGDDAIRAGAAHVIDHVRVGAGPEAL